MKLAKNLITIYTSIIALSILLSKLISLATNIHLKSIAIVFVPIFIMGCLIVLKLWDRKIDKQIHDETTIIKTIFHEIIGTCEKYKSRWEIEFKVNDIDSTIIIDTNSDELNQNYIEIISDIKMNFHKYNLLTIEKIKTDHQIENLDLKNPSITVISDEENEFDISYSELNNEYEPSYTCLFKNKQIVDCYGFD